MLVEGKSSYHRSSKIDHAWNIVEYEGEYFHIDSTWDANTYETIKTYSYDYFGLDDDEIAVDHDWNYKTTPKCNSNKLSFLVSNGLYVNSESQIEDIISRQMKRHEKVIQLKISPGIALVGDGQSQLEKNDDSGIPKPCSRTISLYLAIDHEMLNNIGVDFMKKEAQPAKLSYFFGPGWKELWMFIKKFWSFNLEDIKKRAKKSRQGKA